MDDVERGAVGGACIIAAAAGCAATATPHFSALGEATRRHRGFTTTEGVVAAGVAVADRRLGDGVAVLHAGGGRGGDCPLAGHEAV